MRIALQVGLILTLSWLPFGHAHAAGDLTILNATLIAAPGATPNDGVDIEIRHGRIVRIEAAKRPADAPAPGSAVFDARGRIVTAGLWNSHVHFTDPALSTDAADIIRDMLLRYGFASVVDTGSDPSSTRALQRAIEAGTMAGPRIVAAGGSFVYRNGTPSYLPGIRLPELETPDQAAAMTRAVLDTGLDGIKIFSGSFISPTETIWLPPAIIAAVTGAAHGRGRFVMAHPTDRVGLENAVNNGVDVLAHTAPPAGVLAPDLLRRMIDNSVALVPTLKLWAWELGRAGVPAAGIRAFQDAGIGQLAAFAAAGGQVLFGTDVGYMRDYDTADEFVAMAAAGMTFEAILASLTTVPAARFAGESGRVEVGAAADLVVFAADPRLDASGFSRIAATVARGRVVFVAESQD